MCAVTCACPLKNKCDFLLFLFLNWSVSITNTVVFVCWSTPCSFSKLLVLVSSVQLLGGVYRDEDSFVLLCPTGTAFSVLSHWLGLSDGVKWQSWKQCCPTSNSQRETFPPRTDAGSGFSDALSLHWNVFLFPVFSGFCWAPFLPPPSCSYDFF